MAKLRMSGKRVSFAVKEALIMMQTMIKRFLSPKEQLVKDRCFEYNKFKKEGAELVDNSRKERCYGRERHCGKDAGSLQ